MHERVRAHDYTVVAGMASVAKIDAMLDALGIDAGPAPEKRRVRNGEHYLAIQLLTDAVVEACAPIPDAAPLWSWPIRLKRWAEKREIARAWLCGSTGAQALAARVCAEAVDVDYDAMIEAMRRKWRT